MTSVTHFSRGALRAAVGGILLWMLACQAAAQDMTQALADAAGVPQIPAFLPDRYGVARSEALPIDGLWLISSIRKKIRIEQGRAFAVDPWLHMFVLEVQPDMVVLQNFRRTAAGKYAADDLPLAGPAEMTVNAKGNLDVVVQGLLGPARYGLIRLEPQYPEALTAEIAAATGQQVTIPVTAPVAVAPLPGMPGTGSPAPPSYTPPPAPPPPSPAPATPPVATSPPADCTPIGIDQDTGQTICAY